MSDCTGLSDRMVSVAHGKAGWAPADLVHLRDCPDCAGEWDLVQRGARLGERATETLVPEFMATRVLAELRRPSPSRAPARWLAGWRWLALPVAAAAALMVWRGTDRPSIPVGVEVAAVESLLPELEDLQADELESLLEAVPASSAPTGDVGGLGDLDEGELQAMLRSLEG